MSELRKSLDKTIRAHDKARARKLAATLALVRPDATPEDARRRHAAAIRTADKTMLRLGARMADELRALIVGCGGVSVWR